MLMLAGLLCAQGCGGDTGGQAPLPDHGTVKSPDLGQVSPDGGGGPPLPLPPPPDGMATGTATCGAVLGCLQEKQCKPGDATCANACLATGTAAAQQTFGALSSCTEKAMASACASCKTSPQTEACVSCLETSCQSSYTACGLTQTCAQAADCAMKCGPNDKTCAGACMSKATPTAGLRLMNLQTCMQSSLSGSCKASCSDPMSVSCQSCVKPACASQAQACGLTPK